MVVDANRELVLQNQPEVELESMFELPTGLYPANM
jgi:hypothetical protein